MHKERNPTNIHGLAARYRQIAAASWNSACVHSRRGFTLHEVHSKRRFQRGANLRGALARRCEPFFCPTKVHILAREVRGLKLVYLVLKIKARYHDQAGYAACANPGISCQNGPWQIPVHCN